MDPTKQETLDRAVDELKTEIGRVRNMIAEDSRYALLEDLADKADNLLGVLNF